MSKLAKRQIPLLDLNAQNTPIREEIIAAATRVLDSQRFILGEDIRLLEEEIAAYGGVNHAVGCGSGTDALYLALAGLAVGPGDKVITTPFTFFASAGSIVRCGARPVFTDIDPATYNMDPRRLAEALRAHPEAKAVMPVHLYGASADMDPILETCRQHGCAVVGDAAQAIGSEYRGRSVLAIGDVACLSFFPSKNLGAAGEAGMVTTNDGELAEKMASLRVHGETERYYHRWVGTNSRLDTLQAAILRVKLPHLDEWTRQRQSNAATYVRMLEGRGLPIRLPRAADYQTRHTANQFTIRTERRDDLRQHLTEAGVGTQVYYPVPLHLQECFLHLGYQPGDFPESERAAKEVLSLPVGPGLTEEDIGYVCEVMAGFGW